MFDEINGLKGKVALLPVRSTAGKHGEAGHVDYSVTKSGRLFPP